MLASFKFFSRVFDNTGNTSTIIPYLMKLGNAELGAIIGLRTWIRMGLGRRGRQGRVGEK